jgi:2-acylglycerol O-acyltransferase 2
VDLEVSSETLKLHPLTFLRGICESGLVTRLTEGTTKDTEDVGLHSVVVVVVTIASTMIDTKGSSSSSTPVVLGFLCTCGVMLSAVSLSLSMLVGTFLYPHIIGLGAVLPYYTYTLFLDRKEVKDGAPWPLFSQHFFTSPILRRFLKMKIVASDELLAADAKATKDDENSENKSKQLPPQFVFGVFPHGSNADYRILMDGMLYDTFPKLAPNIRTLAATVLFRIPLIREFALWTSCIDASRAVADRALTAGRSILVMPGGEAEQIRTVYAREKVYLQRRKGFIKIALRHGVPVVPVYVFGVSDYYHTSSFCYGLRLWLVKNMGICIPLAFGLYGSMMCPLAVETTIVFGKPLHFTVKEVGAPSDKEVADAHQQFCDALRELFDEHKKSLGYGDRQLEIM